MKTRKDLQLISALLATLIALPVTSCSSKKREYEVIKESDPWYESTSFEISDYYPQDVYEYSDFMTVGTTDDAIYIRAEAAISTASSKTNVFFIKTPFKTKFQPFEHPLHYISGRLPRQIMLGIKLAAG